jgi:transitional endoplasmic reticulum ATPase
VLEQLLTYAGDHPFRADQRRASSANGPDPVKVTLILDFAEAIVPAGDWATMRDADRAAVVSLQRWALDKRIGDNGSMILLVVRNLSDLHPALRAASAKCEPIEIPLPNLEARRDYIDRLCSDLEQNGSPLCWQDDLTPHTLASSTAGLGLVHIEDIVFRARAAGAISADLVRDRKRDIISSEFGDLLEIVEPRFGWERVGGMEHIKRFFTASVINPLRQGTRRRLPMGVLLVGPPGTGKSLVAEAVAREAGVNFVLLRMGKILGSYVGQSERNLEKALRCIESLAPMICFIDEIDQAIPGRSSGAGDSGVGGRIFGRLLDFIANPAHRGSILWLANTNRVDKLDPALTRPGRFDKIVPFLVPDPAERAHTLAVIAATHELAQQLTISDDVLANTENWTGAELEAAVLKALELVDDEGLTPEAALVSATRSLAPATAGLRELSELAIRATNDRDLLPPRLRARAGSPRDEDPVDKPSQPEQPRVSTRRQRSLA